jgi:TctA family transporter
MDVVLSAAADAFFIIIEPNRLMFLMLGVAIGLVIGILPGISGLAGMALLLPFTYNMDEYTALAFLLGLGSVVTTSDVLTAILFGVPGHSSAQATVLEGYPMARRGEAGRALSVSYFGAMIGGLFGAAVLAVAIPLLRPVMLYIGSPELLAASIFGISMVAALSGSAPLRGLAAAGIGIMFAMVGADPQTGTLRWTLDTLFLWDGLPLLPVALGLFALPELCDLAIGRSAVAKTANTQNITGGMLQGINDVLKHWFLALRCGGIGAAIGAVPGLGSAVIGWLAYAHALRTEKGAQKTFGKGDVRGLIATESANNAKEGGALLPTIAFGVPGSASMAILLGAFLIHGLVPGPEMLTRNLDVTYSMVWSVVLANILGSVACFAFSGYFAKLTLVRYTVILPVVLIVVYVGAFQDSRDWGDFYVLFAFGVLGWIMKQLRWPRPPLILGFVLGEIIERYMFISIGRYDYAWLLHPIVFVLLAMALFSFVRPFMQNVRAEGGFGKMWSHVSAPQVAKEDLFPAFLLIALIVMLSMTATWDFGAKVVPLIVGGITVAVLTISLTNQVLRRRQQQALATRPRKDPNVMQRPLTEDMEVAEGVVEEVEERLHMDIAADHGGLRTREIVRRAGVYVLYLLGFMASIGLIGFIPTVPLFVIAYMRLEGGERWPLTLIMAVAMTLFVWGVFHVLLNVIWPPSYLGEFMPALRVIPSV